MTTRRGAAAIVAVMLVTVSSSLPAQQDSARTAPSTPQTQRSAVARRAAQRDHARYDETFRRYSKRYFGPAFDWRWFKAQGMAESNLNPEATSFVGARGIMQLMPSTYAQIQSRRPEFGEITDPEWNIAAGISHNRYLWRLWDGRAPEEDRMRFMFGSYNAGQGTIGRALDSARTVEPAEPGWVHIEEVAPRVPRWRYRETLGYVRKIDSNYVRLRRQP